MYLHLERAHERSIAEARVLNLRFFLQHEMEMKERL
jgi:hypothetical protein